jgi:hypothetical protein
VLDLAVNMVLPGGDDKPKQPVKRKKPAALLSRDEEEEAEALPLKKMAVSNGCSKPSNAEPLSNAPGPSSSKPKPKTTPAK